MIGRGPIRRRSACWRHQPAESGVGLAPWAGAEGVRRRDPVVVKLTGCRRQVFIGRVVRRVRADSRRTAERIQVMPPDHEARLVGGFIDPANLHHRRAGAVRGRHRLRNVRRPAAGRHTVRRRRSADASTMPFRPDAEVVGRCFQQAGHGYTGTGHWFVLKAGHVGAYAADGLPALDHQSVHTHANAAVGTQRLPANPRVGIAQMRRGRQCRLDGQGGTLWN